MKADAPGMVVFRSALITTWVIIVALSVHALAADGITGLSTFVADFADPWRAQINGDFSVHLCLAMAWIAYREPTVTRSILFAVPIVLGSVYLLPYIVAASFRCEGRFDTLLTGSGPQASHASRC